jgi:adenylate cyclase
LLEFRRGGTALIALCLGVGGVLASVLPPVLELDETIGLTLLFTARGPLPPPEHVAIVNISRDSAAAVGQTSETDEWRRTLHAALIDSLVAAGVEAIAFDLMFEEPRPEDPELAQAMLRAGNVLLVERVVTEDMNAGVLDARRLPVAQLKNAALGTAPFTLPSVPNRVNQFWTFGRASGGTPSLPAVALQAYLLRYYEDFVARLPDAAPSLASSLPRSRVELGALHELAAVMSIIRAHLEREPHTAEALRGELRKQGSDPSVAPLAALVELYAGRDSRYIDYYGPPRTIETIPYDLAMTAAGDLGLAGKMVFVGYSESRQSEQDDDFYSVFSQRSGANLSGVEIAATAFANLLERKSIVPLWMPAHLGLVLAWGVVLGVLVATATTRRAVTVGLALGAAYAAGAYWLFNEHSVWLPVLVPLVGQVPVAILLALSLNYAAIARQRERVQQALGYYVPKTVVNRLAQHSVTLESSRQLLQGTCLFTDAEEYTTVSETLRPEELASLMNEYYTVMFTVVAEHGGLVADTSGDSMVAIWATAEPTAASRGQACRAALAVVDAVAKFNEHRGSQQLPTRVGLESGELLLGNIGAEQRFEYRAIGDIVNTASRLQGLNKLLGTRVLASEATIAGIPGLNARDVGMFVLRGKRVPVRVYEPVGFGAGSDDGLAEQFAAALAHFEIGRWLDARRAFAAILERFPNDGPSAYYAALSDQYASQPPPTWAGAVSVATK